MNWHQLISSRRLGKEDRDKHPAEQRTEFQRDYDRLIFSSPFRRMQNKTQVFPLPGSIFVHNRLTHSLEVSSVGRSLGADVARAWKESTTPPTAPPSKASVPSCLRPVWRTTWAIHPSVTPAKRPFAPSSQRERGKNSATSSPKPPGTTSPTSTATPIPSACSRIASTDGATAAL